MQKEVQIVIDPKTAADSDGLKKAVSQKLGFKKHRVTHVEVLRSSIDARQKKIKMNMKVRATIDEEFVEQPVEAPHYKHVGAASEVHIIGSGPAGLFAALKCIELGKKPVVLERGKDVKERIQDLKAINTRDVVNPESNYCFGEGGAGTYSDGKLYTRSTKRGDTNGVLALLVSFGADKNILTQSHPHIGSNKLPALVGRIREYIRAQGGEVHFNTKVVDMTISGGDISALEMAGGETLKVSKVILATGHSARDIFALLQRKKIAILAKPFAMGVRVEHPQALIDQIQYKCADRGPYLPPSDYRIVKQVNGRGIYSFCMCPGGVIAPCATSPGQIVTNGWSASNRNRPTANSGIVVELNLEDFADFKSEGELAGMAFQQSVEEKAFSFTNNTQQAPAQRLLDFIEGTRSTDLPKTSYSPGTVSVELGQVLPDFIHKTLQEGFKAIGSSMRGYLTNEAVVHAPETRTSSPVRIPRDPDSLEHVQVKGLYPCGEGAGYAGGIVSAAIDGQKCAAAACL